MSSFIEIYLYTINIESRFNNHENDVPGEQFIFLLDIIRYE